jgi:hypothetical protein
VTTPPVVPPVVPPTFDDAKAIVAAFLASVLETGKLKEEVKAFLAEVLHSAIADALAQLGAPGDPLTAWLNGWLTQFRTDYLPGGPLEQTLKNAAHSVKVFLPNEDA